MNQRDQTPPAAPADIPVFCRVGALDDSVGYLMRRVVTLVSAEIERRMEPLGLTDAQWKPLLRLFATGDSTVAALARGCHLDAGAMTRLLDRLEAKNLCRRIRSVEDRRVVNLELTDEGREAARQIPDLVAEVQAIAATGFDQEEFDQLKSYLQRLLVNVLPFGGDGEAGASRSSPSVSIPEGAKK
ncbi:MarR family transcriptional regulator [Xylophilus sp. GOD-11R]|uniref:MarR family winged helix-turn-helix transcriptional regulator n=1 Tax=Xylophilus sp. GOD-11R TaxID=3089814 RepID=UPI00298CA4F9|nr:MarR family transcriptional regulator [Xylophilus sp. GOD-11R]WPB55076.1 MarR family transcriptional regulator [Xylophilus sp. GOD-11R]